VLLFLPLDPGSGMGTKSGSGMNIQGHFFESLETVILGLKILKFLRLGSRIRDLFDFYPGSGMEKFRSGIPHKQIESSTNTELAFIS
jgi:hypothetical protein